MAGGATIDEIEDVYRRRLDELVRVATAIVGDRDRERGRDAVHDAFALAVRKRRSYRREGSVESWLWRFVVHAAKDEARRRSTYELVEYVEARRNGYESDELERVQRSLAQLPERQRLVLFLRYYADLDYGTIAATLGISPGTVGATLNSAHAGLKQRLEEES